MGRQGWGAGCLTIRRESDGAVQVLARPENAINKLPLFQHPKLLGYDKSVGLHSTQQPFGLMPDAWRLTGDEAPHTSRGRKITAATEAVEGSFHTNGARAFRSVALFSGASRPRSGRPRPPLGAGMSSWQFSALGKSRRQEKRARCVRSLENSSEADRVSPRFPGLPTSTK